MSRFVWIALVLICLVQAGASKEVLASIEYDCDSADCNSSGALENETFTPAPDNMVWFARVNSSSCCIEECWCTPREVKIGEDKLYDYLVSVFGETAKIGIFSGDDRMISISSKGEVYQFRKEDLDDGSNQALMYASEEGGLPGTAVGYSSETGKRHDFALWYQITAPNTINLSILDLNGRESFNATDYVVVYEA